MRTDVYLADLMCPGFAVPHPFSPTKKMKNSSCLLLSVCVCVCVCVALRHFALPVGNFSQMVLLR
jgi:hypothetical protein